MPLIRYSLSCILNILWVIDLSLIFLNTSWGISAITKESKYKSVFLSIKNETQCISLPSLSSRLMKHVPSFILDKFVLQETPLNIGWYLK